MDQNNKFWSTQITNILMDQNLFLMDQKQILLNKICYFDGSKTNFDDQNLLFCWIKITKFVILMDQNIK